MDMSVPKNVWLALLICAPSVLLICALSFCVLLSTRCKWKSVDIFMFAIFTEEILNAAFVTAYSAYTFNYETIRSNVSLLHYICELFIWAFTAIRTLQVLTLASLILDRLFMVHWPYKYRLKVRRNHIRYHMIVLSAVALFVGVIPIFAWNKAHNECWIIPFQIHANFSIFMLALLGLLGLATLFCCCLLLSKHRAQQARKALGLCSNNNLLPSGSDPNLRHFRSTGSDSLNRNSLERTKGNTTVKWKAVTLLTLFCYLVNHIPFMAIVILGLVPISRDDEVFQNIVLWLSVVEGAVSPGLWMLSDCSFSKDCQNFWKHGFKNKTVDAKRFRLNSDDIEDSKDSHASIIPDTETSDSETASGTNRIKKSVKTKMKGHESVVSLNRKEWIETMRKKYLPVFYDADVFITNINESEHPQICKDADTISRESETGETCCSVISSLEEGIQRESLRRLQTVKKHNLYPGSLELDVENISFSTSDINVGLIDSGLGSREDSLHDIVMHMKNESLLDTEKVNKTQKSEIPSTVPTDSTSTLSDKEKLDSCNEIVLIKPVKNNLDLSVYKLDVSQTIPEENKQDSVNIEANIGLNVIQENFSVPNSSLTISQGSLKSDDFDEENKDVVSQLKVIAGKTRLFEVDESNYYLTKGKKAIGLKTTDSLSKQMFDMKRRRKGLRAVRKQFEERDQTLKNNQNLNGEDKETSHSVFSNYENMYSELPSVTPSATNETPKKSPSKRLVYFTEKDITNPNKSYIGLHFVSEYI